MMPKKVIRRIPQQSWHQLRQDWRLSFVDYDEIGKPPSTSIQDLLEINESSFQHAGISGVGFSMLNSKEIMLREAIYLTHKASALLRSYSRDIENDDQTYAEVSAYTSSFFLARSITMLLGCYMSSSTVSSRYWLLDGRSNKGATSVILLPLNFKPGHIHTWDLFKNLVVKTTNTPFDPEFNAFVGGMPARDFAKTRNHLQYNNCAWMYDDLHIEDCDSREWIAPFSKTVYSNADPDDQNGHFGVVLSLMLFRAVNLLISDISENISSLTLERDILQHNARYCDRSVMVSSWLS
ncbi:hypothetical protein [Halomonas alimentaria]|uniref:Uncharacterized protein n=1 Tax=Halomonas alimentaria TaxID=147248 RepID=A0A7X4W492_9GAMM|nr:hypothetical protein [Halomonas alimentaria]NAW34034.1 hypothetical protein [Halomonas alimentaria]